jgi:hypothetical protein
MEARPETDRQELVIDSAPLGSRHGAEQWVEHYGDRTSSFASLHPGFETFRNPHGEGGIRYARARLAWVLAAEPLTPPTQRALAFRNWAVHATAQGRRALAFPISEPLAREIQEQGGDALPIGQEPLFELSAYFSDPESDPLQFHPRARALQARGAIRIVELSPEQTLALRESIERLRDQWLESRKGPELSFLSQSRPLESPERKRFFAAFAGDRLEALLSAVPLSKPGSWYFMDVIRHPESRAGTVECLEIEAMRTLKNSGALEVRLGLCPFTGLENQEDWRARLLNRFAPRFENFYAFASSRRFKEKLGPTSWKTLYAASSTRLGMWALHAAAEAHVGPRPFRTLLRHAVLRQAEAWLKPSALKQPSRKSFIIPASFALFSLLHLARQALAPVQSLFERSAYRPENVTWTGALLSPVFHTTPYHFLGNVLSLLFFGIVAEKLLPRAVTAAVLAFGLWASNPVTHLLVLPWLPSLDPAGYTHFLAEWDYGSSNGVYALVGAFAALTLNARLVLVPFVLNGLFLCFALNSWLSLHHLVGLLGGYGIARVFRK